jgi:hypothetical protein
MKNANDSIVSVSGQLAHVVEVRDGEFVRDYWLECCGHDDAVRNATTWANEYGTDVQVTRVAELGDDELEALYGPPTQEQLDYEYEQECYEFDQAYAQARDASAFY